MRQPSLTEELQQPIIQKVPPIDFPFFDFVSGPNPASPIINDYLSRDSSLCLCQMLCIVSFHARTLPPASLSLQAIFLPVVNANNPHSYSIDNLHNHTNRIPISSPCPVSTRASDSGSGSRTRQRRTRPVERAASVPEAMSCAQRKGQDHFLTVIHRDSPEQT